MNKYAILGIVLVAIIGGGIVFSKFFASEENKAIETGVVKEYTVVSLKDRWEFSPESIEVDQGDRVKLTVINEDDYDHGFAIDAFGISQRLPANETINLEFVATKSGEFPFYCSVSCGSGVVDGVERGHFDHIGRFIVKMAQTLGLLPKPDHEHPPGTPDHYHPA